MYINVKYRKNNDTTRNKLYRQNKIEQDRNGQKKIETDNLKDRKRETHNRRIMLKIETHRKQGR